MILDELLANPHDRNNRKTLFNTFSSLNKTQKEHIQDKNPNLYATLLIHHRKTGAKWALEHNTTVWPTPELDGVELDYMRLDKNLEYFEDYDRDYNSHLMEYAKTHQLSDQLAHKFLAKSKYHLIKINWLGAADYYKKHNPDIQFHLFLESDNTELVKAAIEAEYKKSPDFLYSGYKYPTIEKIIKTAPELFATMMTQPTEGFPSGAWKFLTQNYLRDTRFADMREKVVKAHQAQLLSEHILIKKCFYKSEQDIISYLHSAGPLEMIMHFDYKQLNDQQKKMYESFVLYSLCEHVHDKYALLDQIPIENIQKLMLENDMSKIEAPLEKYILGRQTSVATDKRKTLKI